MAQTYLVQTPSSMKIPLGCGRKSKFAGISLSETIEIAGAEGLKIKQKRRAEKIRNAFTTDDLNSLFNAPEYVEDLFKHPYQLYLPVLGLYTGCIAN